MTYIITGKGIDDLVVISVILAPEFVETIDRVLLVLLLLGARATTVVVAIAIDQVANGQSAVSVRHG